MINKKSIKFFKIVLSAVFASLLTMNAKAQFVSLSKSELNNLSSLVKTNKSVEHIYRKFELVGDKALTELPNPVDTIISEGHLANDPRKILTQKSLRDMDKIYALAIIYAIGGKPIYLNKCVDYLIAWGKTNHSIGDPINDTKLDPLFEGYDLIKEQIKPLDKEIIERWMAQVADAEISNPRFRSKQKTGYNNWNSHRIKVVTEIAWILDNADYKKFADTSVRRQITKNLYANGTGVDFEDRDALHYHIYTLEPLINAATVLKRATGVNYYKYVSQTGASIQKSVEFLVPFATGEKTHAEFVNSHTAFDKKRADNHEAGYTAGANFNPLSAIDILSYAAYFNPDYMITVRKLIGTEDKYPNWQAVLNAVRN